MPKIPPIHRLIGTTGTVGNETFCRRSRNGRNQAYARKKRGSNQEKYRTAASCAPIRENGSEFGRASTLGKALRDLLSAQLPEYAINAVSSRLTGTLRDLITHDTSRHRGQRQLLAAHLAGLVGFGFRPTATHSLNPGPSGPVARTRSGGLTLTLPPLPPAPHRGVPAGATHYGYRIALALFDEASQTMRAVRLLDPPPPRSLAASARPAAPLTLSALPTAASANPQAALVVLGLAYYELRAGQLVPLPAKAAPLAVACVSTLAPAKTREPLLPAACLTRQPTRSSRTRCAHLAPSYQLTSARRATAIRRCCFPVIRRPGAANKGSPSAFPAFLP